MIKMLFLSDRELDALAEVTGDTAGAGRASEIVGAQQGQQRCPCVSLVAVGGSGDSVCGSATSGEGEGRSLLPQEMVSPLPERGGMTEENPLFLHIQRKDEVRRDRIFSSPSSGIFSHRSGTECGFFSHKEQILGLL